MDQLHLLANALIEKETLTGKQIKNLLSGVPIDNEEELDFPAITRKNSAKSKKQKKILSLKRK